MGTPTASTGSVRPALKVVFVKQLFQQQKEREHLRKKCQIAAARDKSVAAEKKPKAGRRPRREVEGRERM